MSIDEAVEEAVWDLSDIVGDGSVDDLLDEADRLAEEFERHRGTVATLDATGLAGVMQESATIADLLGRAGNYAYLVFAADTADPANGALIQKVEERSTAVSTRMLYLDLEWAALDEASAEALLADAQLTFCAHHLRNLRAFRPHLLSEGEERLMAEKAVTGSAAWARLFNELTSAIDVDIDGEVMPLDTALSRLASPDRDRRKSVAEAITAALAPGLRTRAYVFNTLMADKATDDRLRKFDHWLASRNLSNEASDESVEALIDSVRRRYDIPQRWYALKARLFGVERLADYDRNASVASEEVTVQWEEARDLVLDCYASFSPQMADMARRFFDERWIHAPMRPGKQPGAFATPVVPSVHPYVFLNWTSRANDVLTLAHELGHGLHFALAADQGVFHQSTPLTLAETASVFGETVVFSRLIEQEKDPNARLTLLAENIEGAIATVFRQAAMNRFEHLVHTARREEGELSVDRFGELWAESQTEMLGPHVEVTDGYRSWWSYIPHFIGTPGYVYAYSYGQLLALSVYRRYEEQGPDFVSNYLRLLAAGGSDTPENLGRIVGCDLADAGFWDGGLDIIEATLDAAETAAFDAGRLSAS